MIHSRSLEDLHCAHCAHLLQSRAKMYCAELYTHYKSIALDAVADTTTMSLSSVSKHSITAIKKLLKASSVFLLEAFDFSLLREVNFLMFLLGSVLNMFGYLIPVLFLPLRCAQTLGKSMITPYSLMIFTHDIHTFSTIVSCHR